ncbi:MAG: VOC family protein [Saprospiraceae bacterium]|nr:VOC family protein [Saprospiraceae bacterium]
MDKKDRDAEPIISGIQQVGLGNRHVYDTWSWYLENLGFNVPVFDEAAEAALMLPYTGGQPRKRHAVLALNMAGGGGYEIWQYVSREGQPADFEVRPGDLGIFCPKVKSSDIASTHKWLKDQQPVSKIHQLRDGRRHFYVKDPWGNPIEIVESNDFFQKPAAPHYCGGIYGATIGVSQMDVSIEFYSKLLGYDRSLVDQTGRFEDFSFFGRDEEYRRVVLTHSEERKGAFSSLLGPSHLELVQARGFEGRKIFKDRMWGDLGYIHVCFDVVGIDKLKEKCEKMGYPFTVDSGDFDMGEAAGRFAYIEDPDGTLIEFVETYRIPLIKKIGWYLNLRNRDARKKLPRWMLKALGLGKVSSVPEK